MHGFATRVAARAHVNRRFPFGRHHRIQQGIQAVADVAAMLQDKISLENLSIENSQNTFNAEECVVLVTSLQQNAALERLQLYYGMVHLTDDEDKQMANILKKNYALESLSNIHLVSRPGDVGAILQLNNAGRRHLIEDGSSV